MNFVELPFDSRLGNWMFQCALGFSQNEPFCLYTAHDSVAGLFARYPGFFHDIKLVREVPDDVKVYQERGFAYSPVVTEPDDANRLFKGYFQSEKYFADRDQIRKFFSPSEEMVATLRAKYGDWLADPNVTGISVRRGDYMRLAHVLPFCGEKYYRDCIAKLPDAKSFIVCSDDFPWCKEFFPKAFPDKTFYFMEGQPVLEQLYVHTLCKNVIMSNSTFAWWSAWLNAVPGKRVFAPSRWLGYKHDGKTDWSSIYFDGVEIVKNGYSLSLWIRAHVMYWDKQFRIFVVKTLRKLGLRK